MIKQKTSLFVESKILNLGQKCRYKKRHAHQVARLSVKLFDELASLHHLDNHKRLLLRWGALLHDIGWMYGAVRHNKNSRDIILRTLLPLSESDKMTLALLARYHRKGLPQNTHKYYGSFNAKQKKEICQLAALLRVADGLDRQHINSVRDLDCRIKPAAINVIIHSDKLSNEEKQVALKKGDLFRKIFKRRLVITSKSH